jgi:hypothetical protein
MQENEARIDVEVAAIGILEMRDSPLGFDEIARPKIERHGSPVDRVHGSRSLTSPIGCDTRQRIPSPFTPCGNCEGVNELTVDLANPIWEIDLRLKSRQPFLLSKLLPTSLRLVGFFLDSGVSTREDPPQEPALLPRGPFLFEASCILNSALQLGQELAAFLLGLGEKISEF